MSQPSIDKFSRHRLSYDGIRPRRIRVLQRAREYQSTGESVRLAVASKSMDETVGGHKNSILSTFMILVNFDVMKTYFDIEGGLADKYGRTDT